MKPKPAATYAIRTIMVSVCLLVGCSRGPDSESASVQTADEAVSGPAPAERPSRDPSELLDLLPADADMAIAIADVNGLVEKVVATSVAGCLRDPAVSPLVNAIRENEPSVAAMERYASYAPLLLKSVSGGAALAFRSGGTREPPSLAGILEIAGREAEAESLLAMLAGFGQMSGRVVSPTVNGIPATVVTIQSPEVTVAWARVEGLLYVSDSAEGLRWLTEGAAERAKVARNRTLAKPADYAIRIERPARMLAAFAGLDLSALDAISRISVRGYAGRSVREELRVELERGGEALTALSSARLGSDLRARVPERALVSLEVAFGDDDCRRALEPPLASLSPAATVLVETADEAAFFFWSLGRIGWYPRAGGAAMLAMDDEDSLKRLDAAALRIARGIRSFASRKPDAEIKMLTGSRLGYLAYGVEGGVAAFGSDVLATREILANSGGRPPLDSADAFARLEVDLAAIADRAVEPYLPALLEMLLPEFDYWFDRDLVPPGALIGGYLGQVAAVAAVRDGSLVVEAESPTGLALAAALALLAF